MKVRTILIAAVVAVAPNVASADVGLYAGAGARFSQSDTAAVASLRATFPVAMLLTGSLELDGYLSGGHAGASMLDFAGGQAGLTLGLPVPGPITPELGVALGVTNLMPSRHGLDDTVLTFNAELALRADFGPVKLRLSWTRPFWSDNEALSRLGLESQLMLSLGLGI